MLAMPLTAFHSSSWYIEGFAGTRREAEILPLRLRLSEIEEVLVEADEQRKVLDRCRGGQVRAFGRGEKEH